MKCLFGWVSVAMVFVSLTNVRAATIDQYGNVHKETWDYMGEAYERSKSFGGGSSSGAYGAAANKLGKALNDYYNAIADERERASRVTVSQKSAEDIRREYYETQERNRRIHEEKLRREAKEKAAHEAWKRELEADDRLRAAREAREAERKFYESAHAGEFGPLLKLVLAKLTGTNAYSGVYSKESYNPSMADYYIMSLRNGPFLDCKHLWSAAFTAGTLGTNELRLHTDLSSQLLTNFALPPALERNMALGALALGVAQYSNSWIRIPYSSLVWSRRVLAGAAATLPAVQFAPAETAVGLMPATALLVRFAAQKDGSFVLSRAAAAAIDTALKQNFGMPFDGQWAKLAPALPATGSSPIEPVAIHPDALTAFLRLAQARSSLELESALATLRAKDAKPRAWAQDVATREVFRSFVDSFPKYRFVERDEIIWKKEAALLRRELELAFEPYSEKRQADFARWQANFNAFTNNPSPRKAAVMLEDAAQGSPAAVVLLDIVFDALNGSRREEAYPTMPDFSGAMTNLLTPTARCLAAWELVRAYDGKLPGVAESNLVRQLTTVTTNEHVTEAALFAQCKAIAFGLREPERAERIAEGAYDAKLMDNFGQVLSFNSLLAEDARLALRLARATKEDLDNAQFVEETARSLNQLLYEMKSSGSEGSLTWSEAAANAPLFVERLRQLDAGYERVTDDESFVKTLNAIEHFEKAKDYDEVFGSEAYTEARHEFRNTPWQRTMLDALMRVTQKTNAPPQAYECLYQATQNPWFDGGLQTRSFLRLKAESLAAKLMYYRFAPEEERDRLKQEIRAQLFVGGESREGTNLCWELAGRDFAAGGLVTEALDLARVTYSGKIDDMDAWLALVGEQPVALPAEDRLAAIAKQWSSAPGAETLQFLGMVLVAAADRNFYERKPGVTTSPIRLAALKLLAERGVEIHRNFPDLYFPLMAVENKFTAARAEWELAKLHSPQAKPIELAAPIVKKLGASAAALPFAIHNDVRDHNRIQIHPLIEPLRLEADPVFAGAVLRCVANASSDGVKLVNHYLKSETPDSYEAWKLLVSGKSW